MEYKKFVESSETHIMCVHSTKDGIRYINKVVEDILGYTPRELIGTNPCALIYEPDLAKIGADNPKKFYAQVREGNNFLARFKKKDSTLVYLRCYIRRLESDNEDAGYLHSISVNAEEDVQRMATINQYRQGLQLVTSILPNTIAWAVDKNLNLIFMSGQMLGRMGLRAVETPMPMSKVYEREPKLHNRLYLYERVFETGESVQFNQVISGYHLDATLVPIRGADESVVTVLGIGYDVTSYKDEVRQAEEKTLNQILKEALAPKSEEAPNGAEK